MNFDNILETRLIIIFSKKDAKEIIVKLDNERKAYDTQIQQMKLMTDNLKSELEKTYALLNDRKKERDEAYERV